MTMLSADHDAFARAIAIYRKERRGGDEHITIKIQEDGFEAAGRFCAYWCQSRNLKLEPQEFPPAWLRDIDDVGGPDFKRKPEAARLLKRLLERRLSQFEPDPIGALAAAEMQAAIEKAPTPSAQGQVKPQKVRRRR